MSSLTTRLATYWATGQEPGRNGGAHSLVMPYQVWQTADGYIVAGVWNGGNVMWPKFCQAAGLPELADNPRYATPPDSLAHRDELGKILQAQFLTQPTAVWEEGFRKLQVLFSPIYTFGELLNHPHVQQAGIVGHLHHPLLGDIPQLTPAISLSETPGGLNRHPPMLGEHTRAVLGEAGYTAEEIEQMVQSREVLTA